jgi:hypothetical protein
MAVIPFAGSWLSRGVHQTIWSGLATGDTGTPQSDSSLPDKSVQVSGTFGAGTVTLEGSNDGTTYLTLTDPAGAALSFTAAGGPKQVLQNPKFVRPSVVGGAASAIIVTLLERGGAI